MLLGFLYLWRFHLSHTVVTLTPSLEVVSLKPLRAVVTLTLLRVVVTLTLLQEAVILTLLQTVVALSDILPSGCGFNAFSLRQLFSGCWRLGLL